MNLHHITTKELIADDIAAHGAAWTAKRYAKKMPFTIFHFLAFGYLPRTRLVMEPVYDIKGKAIIALPRVIYCH